MALPDVRWRGAEGSVQAAGRAAPPALRGQGVSSCDST